MKTNTGFPKELLKKSSEEKIDFFRSKAIEHPILRDVFGCAWKELNQPSGSKVIVVTGPTGIGKTTMVGKLYNHVIAKYSKECEKDPAMIPAIRINAIPSTTSSSQWKDIYIRLLQSYGEVLIDHKLLVADQLVPNIHAGSALQHLSVDTLRRALENCIRNRKTKVLLIDEAHHLLLVPHAQLELQFEKLKSLCVETGVTIVLSGTYRLLDIREQSGQLARRSKIIQFPHYDFYDAKGREDFELILKSFAHYLPLQEMPDLLSEAESFYLKTAGSVGLLKDLLTECLKGAIEQNKKTFDFKFAERCASCDNETIARIVEESMDSQRRFAPVSIDDLRKLMQGGTSEPSPKAHKPFLRRRVAERKPHRDETGGIRHVA